MKNLRHLTYPSPMDLNVRTGIDPLAALRHGASFYHNGTKRHIDNGTGNNFNHSMSTGGYHSRNVRLYDRVTPQYGGGISIQKRPNQPQYVVNRVTNALVAAPVYPAISELVDKPLPPSINPIAVK